MRTKLSKEETLYKKSDEYVIWRMQIYYRDNYTCQICGHKGKDIEAHHIYPYRDYPHLRTDLNNGVTLCAKCHRSIFGKEMQIAEELKGLIENGVNSVKLSDDATGDRDNTEPSRDGDISEGVTTRKWLLDTIQHFRKYKVKCCVCGKELERHYYRYIKSKHFICGKGECRKTFAQTMLKGINSKPIPKQYCKWCGKEMPPTPTQKHREKKFCNNTCQMKWYHKYIRK